MEYNITTKDKWEVGYGDNSKALGVFTKEMLDKGLHESPICLISPIDKMTDTDLANAKAIALLPELLENYEKAVGLLAGMYAAKIAGKNQKLENEIYRLNDFLSNYKK